MSQWSESEFREFLQGQMLFEPSERKSDGFVKAVAAAMGISQWNLYDILKGRVDLSPDRLPVLCNAIRKVAPESDIPRRLLAWMVSRCEGFVLQEEVEAPTGSIEEEVDDITIASMDLIREKIEAMRDGNMDAREREKLYRYCMRIQRECNQALLALAPQEERKRA
jgi:DNA-binding transcriptional regulator YdaS (Cro superfamily)